MATTSASRPAAAATKFTAPSPGASLLLAFTPPASSATPARRTVLVIGQGRLAAARAFSCLEAGLNVVVARDNQARLDEELQARLDAGELDTVDLPEAPEKDWQAWLVNDLRTELFDDILLVCITDTILSSSSIAKIRSPSSALSIRKACYKLRIPVNVADHPDLSDFHFPATYRFPLLPSSASNATAKQVQASPLQIAVTTNAKSCRLASRIRREIVTKLPKGVGSAVAKVGELRESARRVDQELCSSSEGDVTMLLDEGEREEGWSSTLLNKPVPQILMPPSRSRCTSPNRRPSLINTSFAIQASHIPLTPPATPPPTSVANKMEEILSGVIDPKLASNSLTRMRFIAQISEYWPIERIATLSDAEAARVISLYTKSASIGDTSAIPSTSSITTQARATNGNAIQAPANGSYPGAASDTPDIAPRHELSLEQPLALPENRGRIFLLGSGPGSPSLLTRAAHSLLTKHATLILSDKLVPTQILALIPKHIPLTIAKKFPGNAEGAQNELMDLAYEGAMRGETVVRLKQGDPYVYGRGGEEVLFFRERGFESVVVPGISSAFAAPLMAGIPVTQRGVSESVVVCTGVGRKGKGVKLPGYERARTTVVLMGVARLPGVIQALTSSQGEEGHGREGGARDGAAYPPYCPIAIIEKASSPDQRMVASTLEGIVDAMDRAGEQRPPGMMIIGWSALALEGKGDVDVLDGVEGFSLQEQEKVDRARIDRWLGPKGFIVREGLDASWTELLDREDEQIRQIEEL